MVQTRGGAAGVSATAFQAALARIVTNRFDRAEANAGRVPDGLDHEEAAHIQRLAADPGLIVTAKLVASFRLGKVLALLPLTRERLGNVTLAVELDGFWLTHPPVSFFMPDEVTAFCDYLLTRIDDGELPIAHLRSVVALERAEIAERHPDRTSTHPVLTT